MNVIHLISGGDTGGAKTHVLSLLAGLNQEITADLVCFMEGPFSREAVSMGIPVTVLENSFAVSMNKVRHRISEGNYDLIHCHGSRANLMAAILKRHFNLPVVCTIHSDYRLDYMGRPGAALTYGKLNAWAIRQMDYLVCVSDQMKSTLIERGFRPNNMFSIYNGIDFSVSVPRTDRRSYFERIGCSFGENDVIAGIAARLDPVKDIATLIRAVAKARTACPNLKLMIAGDGAELEPLQALASELGIRDEVFFAGWVDDMSEFYGALDINTLTSLSETFPYAITEGARAKLATVSSNVGGVPKLIEHGKTGYLFMPGDTDALSEALTALASSEDLRSSMGNSIYEKASSEFSTARTCQTQLEIYDTVLRRKERKARHEKDGVVICGAYGHGNAGDEAILEAIIEEIRSVDPYKPITVLSRSPKETRKTRGVDSFYRFNILKIRSSMTSAELYINGGGSLIQDVTSRSSLNYYLYTIAEAKRRNCRVYMYGCGIGPVNYDSDIRLARKVINDNVDVITVREPHSMQELNRFGVDRPEIILTSDPAIGMQPAEKWAVDRFMTENGLDPEGSYMCICLRRWPGFESRIREIAKAVEYAYRKHGMTPVFLSINRIDDNRAAERVAEQMAGVPYHIISSPMDSHLTIGIIARMRIMVSMRLHGLIFAAGQGLPLVGLSYDPKVSAFTEYIGSGPCMKLEDVTADQLIDSIDHAISQDGSQEDRLARAEKLKKLEKENVLVARRLLEEDTRREKA